MAAAAIGGEGEQRAREIELKLAVSARELPRLRRRLALLGDGKELQLDNLYFDTAERLLRRHRMALRVRRIGRRWVQTLKTEAGASALASRGEWELPAPRGRLDLARFAGTPLAALLGEHPETRLLPAFCTRFRRTVWMTNDDAIEVALDEGEIVAADRHEPILELELELKAGPAEALFRLASDLAGKGDAALALLPAVDSKAARGYRLAAAEPLAPRKANAAAVAGALPGDCTPAAALRSVVERGTALLLANAAGVADGRDAEFVHQARVAVRRLRSAVRLLGKAAGWPAALDAELRWIARRLGAARDWDVLQTQTLPALLAALPAATPLARQVAEARRSGDEALGVALAGARYARLALRLMRWAGTPADEGPTIAVAAGRQLRRLHRRLFGSAAFFVALTVDEQHRVRIRAKWLRYALDVLAPVLPPKPTRRYVEQLARVQDELGALNDAVVAAQLLPRLARAAGIDARPALDWLEERRRQHSLGAEVALAALARLRRPWDLARTA